jgi:hypothetical protein
MICDVVGVCCSLVLHVHVMLLYMSCKAPLLLQLLLQPATLYAVRLHYHNESMCFLLMSQYLQRFTPVCVLTA